MTSPGARRPFRRLLAFAALLCLPAVAAPADQLGTAEPGPNGRFRIATLRVEAQVEPRCGVSALGATDQAAQIGVDCTTARSCVAVARVDGGRNLTATGEGRCSLSRTVRMAANAAARVVEIEF
ncbi:hypothetical protein [Zavarzinia sp.]|uniref:hypothetical protein n=1 Tax=Zavarzinia sp. TaxID=2027920 RepID=UPI00356293AC